MFVQRKKSILNRFDRYKCRTHQIAFMCNKRMSGFTVGKLYKPFAYSMDSEYYKNFCIFDDIGCVMFMQRKYINSDTFSIVYTNYNNIEFVTKDIMKEIDTELDKFRYILQKG